jgi:hypothetical protein
MIDRTSAYVANPPNSRSRATKLASAGHDQCRFACANSTRGECHNENNKQRFVSARLMGTAMWFRSNGHVGNFSANWPMKCLLVLCLTAVSGTAFAQATGSVESTAKQPPGKDEVPPGGCMPIGLTASGEIVFPFACRALIERQRGTIDLPNPKPAPAGKQETPPAAVPAQAASPAK